MRCDLAAPSNTRREFFQGLVEGESSMSSSMRARQRPPRFRPGNPGTKHVKPGQTQQTCVDFVEIVCRAFPSHGRGRRFNPYSAHHYSPPIDFADKLKRNEQGQSELLTLRNACAGEKACGDILFVLGFLLRLVSPLRLFHRRRPVLLSPMRMASPKPRRSRTPSST